MSINGIEKARTPKGLTELLEEDANYARWFPWALVWYAVAIGSILGSILRGVS